VSDRWDQVAYDLKTQKEMAKAKAVWNEKYKNRKPSNKEVQSHCTEYTFHEGVVETEKAVLEKSTVFLFLKSGEVYMHKRVNKTQLFLAVNGPAAGKRIKDDDKDYILFNRSGRYGKDVPKAVLVWKHSFDS
jgi:hypothetical protein